ncbi:O-antigen ligase family protein [Adhaeribacter rhizoryzae]|uniref:O-antigen ligase family protein n=1 Tax=Adhaeribacter rhizoryzae TaxID=2607907 RepID=UPI00167FDFB8|nr:O-antigen ligase family protein [Adhaeribacter rhizoryzae]
MYLTCILFLAGYDFRGYLKTFNKVALSALLVTLLLYVYNWLTFGGGTSAYLHLTTWDVNYVPSGLSNLNFSIFNFSFSRSAGNHGIYGSYLVLVYLVNLYLLLKKREEVTKLNYILIGLVVINLVLLTSRESLLIFLIVNLFFFIKDIISFRLKKHYLYLLVILVLFINYVLIKDIDFGLISKIKHTIQSYQESGGEQNINLRFRVWMLILLSYSLYPFSLLVGYGYNQLNFVDAIASTNNYYDLYKHYASVPESLFFLMLAYGGLFSLLLLLAFFFQLFNRLLKLKKFSALHELFLYFTIGIFISNNTGGSLMSDLLLAQFSLFYLFLNKWYVQEENFTYYSKG